MKLPRNTRRPPLPFPACYLAVIEDDAGSLGWFQSQTLRAVQDRDRAHLARIVRRARSFSQDAGRAVRLWSRWLGYPVRGYPVLATSDRPCGCPGCSS